MNAHLAIAPQPRLSFQAWKVAGNTGVSYPLDMTGVTTVADAIRRALIQCSHKDVFEVLASDAVTGGAALHTYRVKQSSKYQRVPHEDGTTRTIKPLEADHVITRDVHAFVPVEPWKWSPGADVVGIDCKILEV